MKKIYTLSKSTRKNKKYMVLINEDWVHFGDSDYEDYTIHKDKKRKENYIKRHTAHRRDRTAHRRDRPALSNNWKNINSPAFWSLNLLWNKPTIKESIKDIEKKNSVRIDFKKNP